MTDNRPRIKVRGISKKENEITRGRIPFYSTSKMLKELSEKKQLNKSPKTRVT